jgi:hypothetical protein
MNRRNRNMRMNASMQLLETENQCIKAQTIKVATGHISYTHTHTHTHIYIYIKCSHCSHAVLNQ